MTNLPNIGDLDDALTRPGRCFAHLIVRALLPAESRRLLTSRCGLNEQKHALAIDALGAQNGKVRTVADVYKAFAPTR